MSNTGGARRPRCTRVPESVPFARVSLRELRSDGVDLEVDLEIEGGAALRVTFRDVVGFRVLDERELCEFWNEHSTPNGWLWEVHEGGWLALERTRPSFDSLRLPLREWLLVDDRCIGVLAMTPPEVRELGADRAR